MRNHSQEYFFAPPEQITGDEVIIEDDEFAHLVHVMRRKVGDIIRIVDGKGTAYDVALEEMRKKAARGRIFGTYREHNEPPVAVTLAAGVLKNPSRYDFLVEKATELGMTELFPLTTQRTIPNHAKTDRWQKLALSAMKQSCRSWLPVVRPLTSLPELLAVAGAFDVKFIAHEGFEQSANLRAAAPGAPGHVLVLIGPEGGFTDEEVRLCLDAGCKPLSLGVRRLRTETAAVAAMTLIGDAFFSGAGIRQQPAEKNGNGS